MSKPRRLTKKHHEVMRAVKDGADIWGYGDAALLREVQQYDPELIDIGRPMMADDVPGHCRQPYFGAILTNKGRAILALVDAKPGQIKVTDREKNG